MIWLGFAAKPEGQILGEVCFELLHITPEDLAKKPADQVQFAIQWSAERNRQIKDDLEYQKWKATRQ